MPGNHDVGDHPERAPRQPVTTERLDRFRRHFGRDRWMLDRDGWRILGLNSQGRRRLAVFIHKPLFAVDPAESWRT